MAKPILHLFWIAEYQDGTALPQFDPDTGEEHMFKEIDHARLKRFGWYAFAAELAGKVPNAVVNLNLKHYVLSLRPRAQRGGGNLIAYRTTTVSFSLKTLDVSRHSADEYVLGLQHGTLNPEHRTVMHIFTDGRVELT